MLFTFGQIDKLKGKSWAILELKGETEAETYLRRILQVVKRVFEGRALEFYVPIKARGLGHFELLEGTFTYVRSDYFVGLARLKRVWGVDGLVTKCGTGHLRDVLWVEDKHIQELQQKEQELDAEREGKIILGAGVRVLDGQYRDFHGRVTERTGGKAEVEVDLGFRKILLSTFARNLREEGGEGEQGCWIPGLEFPGETEEIQTEVI